MPPRCLWTAQLLTSNLQGLAATDMRPSTLWRTPPDRLLVLAALLLLATVVTALIMAAVMAQPVVAPQYCSWRFKCDPLLSPPMAVIVALPLALAVVSRSAKGRSLRLLSVVIGLVGAGLLGFSVLSLLFRPLEAILLGAHCLVVFAAQSGFVREDRLRESSAGHS